MSVRLNRSHFPLDCGRFGVVQVLSTPNDVHSSSNKADSNWAPRSVCICPIDDQRAETVARVVNSEWISRCLGALIVDWDRLGPAYEPVDHREDRLWTGAERERALTADDVDVQRRKWLVGWQASEGGAWIWVRVLIMIIHFTISYVCGYVATYARPPDPLGHAA